MHHVLMAIRSRRHRATLLMAIARLALALRLDDGHHAACAPRPQLHCSATLASSLHEASDAVERRENRHLPAHVAVRGPWAAENHSYDVQYNCVRLPSMKTRLSSEPDFDPPHPTPVPGQQCVKAFGQDHTSSARPHDRDPSPCLHFHCHALCIPRLISRLRVGCRDTSASHCIEVVPRSSQGMARRHWPLMAVIPRAQAPPSIQDRSVSAVRTPGSMGL
jgi:hypothetical protein